MPAAATLAEVGAASPAAVHRYAAFISYSHHDAEIARWLHAALEKFAVPRRLRGQYGRARLAPVFRDEAELASSASLSQSITEALQQSAALIVIASPASARSRWVEQEITAFRRLGRASQVLCLIVDGQPDATDRGLPEQECFAPSLRCAADAVSGRVEPGEPLAVDLRKDGKRDALLRLAAGLLGVGFDALKRREQRRRQRQLLIVAAASVVGMAITSTLALRAYWAEQEARRQQQQAERQARIARETTGFVVSLFQTADPFKTRGESITAREVLDAGLVRIRSSFSTAPEIRASLIGSMGEVYLGLGLFRVSGELFTELQDRALFSTLDTLTRLRFLNSHAQTRYDLGDYAGARELAGDAARLLVDPGTAADPIERSRTRNLRAVLAVQDGDEKAAESWLQQNLEQLATAAQDTRLPRALNLLDLGMLRLGQRNFVAAEEAFQASRQLRLDALGRDHPWVAEVDNALAANDYSRGQFVQAEERWKAILPSFRKYFGEQHPAYSSLLQNFALTVLERGDFAQAHQLFTQTLAIDSKDKADDHDDLAFSLNSLALAEIGLGRPKSAVSHLDRGIVIARKHRHRMLAPLLMNRADVACRQGDPAPVASWLDESKSALEKDYAGIAWRAAQFENVKLFCTSRRAPTTASVDAIQRTLPPIIEHWGPERLYSREAQWRLQQLRALAASTAVR